MVCGIFLHTIVHILCINSMQLVPVTDFHIVVFEKFFIPLMCIYRYSSYWCTVATCNQAYAIKDMCDLNETMLESHIYAFTIWKFHDLCHFVKFSATKICIWMLYKTHYGMQYFSNELYVVSLGLCPICLVI